MKPARLQLKVRTKESKTDSVLSKHPVLGVRTMESRLHGSHRRQRPRRRPIKFTKKGPIFLGILFLLSLGSWVWGELTHDPFSQVPLSLASGVLRFDNFTPELKEVEDGHYLTRFEDGTTARYTVDAGLQRAVKTFFEKYKVPYGAFVAIHPKTGKVLALVDHSTREPEAAHLSIRASYPAASLFKLITAAAVVEEKQVAADMSIPYRGDFNRLKPAYWKDNPKKDVLKTTLAEAFAHSNNVVFAKVATQWLDTETLLTYGRHFQFNTQIPFESPVEPSRIEIDESESGLAKTGAGFGAVYLSPLHAALLGAAVANDGVMMKPCMVDFVTNKAGETLYECQAQALSKTVSPETAATLRDMMGLTVKKGTVQDVFHHHLLERSLRGISIGGKTGSLYGNKPKGRYTWFVGMAPLDDPEIVVAAMVVNDPVWHIIAPQAAKAGLAHYFATHETGKN